MPKNMQEVFKENDRGLYLARIGFAVVSMLMLIGVLVGGIAMCCTFSILGGIALIIGGLLFLLLGYIVYSVLIAFYLDIKFIRNYLYFDDRSEIKTVIEAAINDSVIAVPAKNQDEGKGKKDVLVELSILKDMFEKGLISQQEYAEESRKILQRYFGEI